VKRSTEHEHLVEHDRLRRDVAALWDAVFPKVEPPPPPPPASTDIYTRLADLSQLGARHDCGPIPGMPVNWSWSTVSRPAVPPPYTGRTHHNVWGQVVPGTLDPIPDGVFLEISRPRVAHVVDGVWQTVKDMGGTGSSSCGFFSYNPTYAGTNHPRAVTYDPATGVSRADLASLNLTPRTMFHWWHSGDWPRIPLPVDRGPVALTCWLRLTGPGAATARIVGAFSGDTFLSAEDSSADGDFVIPRHTWVTTRPQLFGMVVGMTPDEIVQTRPPLAVAPAGWN
jgi:hypothetical protein